MRQHERGKTRSTRQDVHPIESLGQPSRTVANPLFDHLFAALDVFPIDQASTSSKSMTSPAGQALPNDIRILMEDAFNTDFSRVTVHESALPNQFGARAFAQGNELHFRPGVFDPLSIHGRELIGHELAHIVQQSNGRTAAATDGQVLKDATLETEARTMGIQAARGETVTGIQPGSTPRSSIGAAPIQCDETDGQKKTEGSWLSNLFSPINWNSPPSHPQSSPFMGVAIQDSWVRQQEQRERQRQAQRQQQSVSTPQQIQQNGDNWLNDVVNVTAPMLSPITGGTTSLINGLYQTSQQPTVSNIHSTVNAYNPFVGMMNAPASLFNLFTKKTGDNRIPTFSDMVGNAHTNLHEREGNQQAQNILGNLIHPNQ
jgi:Domain of unknown function (DUF4157)